MLESFKERHDFVVNELNTLPGVRCIAGQGTFYSFPDVSGMIDRLGGVNSDVELAEYLINEAGVALVPGSAFGAPGHLRLSFATDLDTLQEALRRLKNVLKK